ncbi:MAG: nucleoside hydrolase [Coprobacillus sp.]
MDILNEDKIRIIICSDAKNEADDQYAIVHALLTKKFDIKGIVAVHFREEKTNQLSYDEIVRLAKLTKTYGNYPIVLGANQKLMNKDTYEVSDGARLIVNEALKEDKRPLYVLHIGALTDMAIALLEHPEISSHLTSIWVGGGRYPNGSEECNLKNDLLAAQIVFSSSMELWQIPSSTYKTTLVSIAELEYKVKPKGSLGLYLYNQLIDFATCNKHSKTWINSEVWIMGDSGAIGVLLDEQKGYYEEINAPIINDKYEYLYSSDYRKIRVYKELNNRMIIEDMFSKISLFDLKFK